MLAAGLEGRWFIGVGNHEVWGDPNIEGVLSAVPYLKKLGVTPERLIYKFDFKDVRFIFLWSGKYDYRSPSLWDGDRPKYAEQMKQMQDWLDDAKAKGIRKAFITFHYPVFCRSGLGPIPEPDNPHKLIAPYAKDMEVVVFNGHVHTTEMYDVDGVKYLMLGGGGAEQDPILPGQTSIKVPADYPPDLYWKGEPPKEEYNYVLVDVEPGQKTKFTLNRFRPWSAEPFATDGAVHVRRCRFRRDGRCMATALLILHGLVAVALLGAITHQTLAAWAPAGARQVRSSAASAPSRPPLRQCHCRSVCARRTVGRGRLSVLQGRHQPDLERDRHWQALGLFDTQGALRCHRVGTYCQPIGFAGGEPLADEPARTRAALTADPCVHRLVGLSVGHVMNNIMGFGS